MNVRKFHVETLQQGSVQGWNERSLTGISTWGLPHMAPLPMAYVGALLPYRNLYSGFGWASCGLLILGAWFAYAFVKELVGFAFPSFVGAALYALSPYSIFLNLSVDDVYFGMLLVPLVMLVIRRCAVRNYALSYLCMSLLLGLLFWVSFLQVIAYALILFGAYSLWRGYRSHQWTIPAILAASVVTALALAAPRMGSVAEDLRLLYRASGFTVVAPIEILRIFRDGIFGDVVQEGSSINPDFNPYEGIRLCVAGFATLLVITRLIRSSDGTWFPLIPVRRDDFPFFFLFFVAVAAFLSVLPLQHLLYYLFLKQSLLHGKLSIVALLPLCVLVAALLHEARNETQSSAISALQSVVALGTAIVGGISIAIAVPALAWTVTDLLKLPESFRWEGARYAVATVSIVSVGIELLLFIGIIAFALARDSMPLRRTTASWLLGIAMVASSFLMAYERINGSQTKLPPPMFAYYFLSAGPNDFRLPTPESLAAMHRKVEARDYRSVVIAPPAQFPHSIAPHIAQFWGFRLLEGYINGLPTRMLALPWPKDVQGLRTIQFTSEDQIDWTFLSALNVKYAIKLNEALYFNRGRGGSDIHPDEIDVMENPLPVMPRVFWVGTIRPASDAANAAIWYRDATLRSKITNMAVLESYVEGLDGIRTYATSGKMRADFNGDHVMLQMEPSDQPRFLVINEMFHPRWRAYAGERELRIYPTNAIMRGIEVPPNVTDVQLRFIPFVRTLTAWIIAGSGFLLLLGLFAFLRRRGGSTIPKAEMA
ncbi:MAG: hypothetical protein WBL29_02860 [Burkholderiales bacterium]